MKKSILLTLILLFSAISALPQGTTTVNVTGIPPVLPSPFVNDLENNYYQGHYQMQVNYTSTNPVPVDFVYEIYLTRNGSEILSATSQPVSYTPGTYFYQSFDDIPAISFPESFFDYFTGDVAEQIIRAGILPEGSYALQIEVVPLDAFSGINSIPSTIFFEVIYPQPPMLVSPMDDTSAPPVYAVFSWTPIVGAPGFIFEYELLIVEVFPGQTAQQAIESNYEHLNITTQQPLFIYTHEHLPLELGSTYAWMVTARDINDQLPLSDDGQTEVFTFTVEDIFADFDFDELESILLIPGFAEIINLEQLEVTQGDNSITLNGPATLQIDFPDETGMLEIGIQCFDLQIPLSGSENPIAYGGSISGNVNATILPVEGSGSIIQPETIQWSVFDGLTVEASIIDPTGQYLEATGTLNLMPDGLSGVITATGPGGSPLVELGENPLEFIINGITASFPGAYLSLDARVQFFNDPAPCMINDVFMGNDGATSINFACNIDQNIPIIPGTELATLFLSSASGEIIFDWDQSGIEFTTTVNASVQLEAIAGQSYNIPVLASLSSTDGVSFDITPPSIILNPPPIDLGIAEVDIIRFKNPILDYTPSVNEWDFGVDMDVRLRLPDFDELEISGLTDLTLDKNGIGFPGIEMDEEDLAFIPRLELGGFGAKLTAFNMEPFTFPWFTWDGVSADMWDFSFDFEFTTPNFGNHLPSCLRNLSLNIQDASFTGGAFEALLPATTFSDDECTIQFGAGYGISINQLGGGIFGQISNDEFELDAFISLDANLLLGAPFDCDDGNALSLGVENFSIRGDGIIEGTLTDIVPPCPLKIGPYTAGITESALQFGRDGSSQFATFEAEAYLEFPTQGGGTNQVQGQVGVDLVTGEFYELDFQITDPFVWVIPNDEEVLRFNINQASISLDGLFIDGVQEFVAGDQTISVTANQLLLDLESFTITSGSISFSEGFAFQAGIDPSELSLSYGSVPLNSDLELDPGILFNLAGEIIIDSDGLQVSGTADAQLNFAGFEIDDLSATFSDDFAFGLDPFKVISGEIDVQFQGQTLAIIDQAGFHPAFGFFDLEDVIPAHLPLPNHDIAYIILKEDDELLIDIEQDPDDDFAVLIATKPGQPVQFVFPVLQGDQATPPTLDVEFSGITLSLSPLQFQSGEIHVSVPELDERFDLSQLGIPLDLKQISYGQFSFEDIFLDGLFLSGDLLLFDEELGDGADITFYVGSDGSLSTSIIIEELNAQIPLVPGSDLAILSIGSLSGWAEFQLLQPVLPEFQFNITGGFELTAGEEHSARANIGLEYSRQGIFMQEFEYDVSSESPKIDIDPFIFQVNKIHALDLSYDSKDGFDFFAQLDFAFGMRFEDNDTLLIPLQGVEIRPTGFAIPAQEVNDGSSPPLQVPPVNLLGFDLEPLAFRTSAVVVNVFDFSPGDLSGLIPRMDFGLSFPELADLAPDLEGLSLTVLDAGYQNGSFTGSIEVHQPLQPIKIPLGETELEILEFAGNLYESIQEGEARQAIDVSIEGNIPSLHQFETDAPCPPIDFALMIVEGSGFSGNIENVIPCGAIPLGSMGLSFTSSSVELEFEEGQQSFILAGGAILNIPRSDQPDINVSGEIALDLMTGNILDGSIEITDAFQWYFPADAEDPFLEFTVQQATLDMFGLTLKADGSMAVSEGVNVDVTFDDLVISLADFSIMDGEASISAGFGFELAFMPIEWQMVTLDQAIPEDQNVIRMDFLDVGIKLDADGLGFTGEASAKVSLPDLPGDDDPDDPEDDEKFWDNLRLVFIDDFRMHIPPATVAKNGRAEIWLDEDEESTLLAWYDTDGLGLGDILGVLPIPDTLGLPTKDIAYMVLRDEEGELLVELDIENGERTLRTKDGEAIDIVIAGLQDDEGENPRFSTAFSITVNDVFEILEGSIEVNLADNPYGNNPFKVPELPITLTSLTYERREDNIGALSASALLDLPESLQGLQVSIDELRFSQLGFEQASFSIGSEDFDEGDDPEFTQSFADDALIVNLYYASISFGETNEFAMQGTFQSSFFVDEDNGDDEDPQFVSLPFDAQYVQSDNPGWGWSFGLDLSVTDTLSVSYARFVITQFEALATNEEFSLILSGVISMPEILGDEFAVTIEELSVGTGGISIGSLSADAQEQEFFFFDERVRVLISSIAPSYDAQDKVLYISMDGELEVLEREIAFSNMTIGSDGSFDIGDGVDVNLLTEDLVILEDHLVVSELLFGITEENKLRMGVTGNVTLPQPFEQSSAFTVYLTQIDRFDVDISIEGPAFTFGDGFEISDDRIQIALGDFATLDLTGLAVDIDFKDISNTSLLATAAVYIENDVTKRIEFGEAANIFTKWGFRFNYNDGIQWNITNGPSSNNPLFSFDAGFFAIAIHSVAPYDTEAAFGIEIGGKASLLLPEVTGEANFKEFKISTGGIEDIGRFDGGVSFTLMDKVSLSLGDFIYEPNGGVLTLQVEGDETDMENPEVEEMSIVTQRHLVISDASISINGSGNGNGGGFDTFAGGVEQVLFYITQEDELYLYIDNAYLTLGDLAAVNVSMRYITADDFFHLSVAGSGEFQIGEAGASLGVAGKIQKDGSDISFGLFVRADVTPGIPIIPAIITLNGLGGGFYYRPDEADFNMVRSVSGINFIDEPSYSSGTRFAAFFYAGIGILGEEPACCYVEGTFFLEATDQFTSLHVNGELLGQDPDNLLVSLFLNVDYGENPGIQGLVRVDVDYSPAIEGMGQIGFFAQKPQNELIWAIYGELNLEVLGAAELNSDFIACNDGMLINASLSVSTSGWWGSVYGGVDASLWYIETSGFGAYGIIEGNITAFGQTIGGYLHGAYVQQHQLFYAGGGVYVDTFIFSGDVQVWVAYDKGKWNGGRGNNPEYMALVQQAQQEAQQMADAASSAASQVESAQQDLADAANIQALIDDVMDLVDNLGIIQSRKATMDQKVAQVNQMAPGVIQRLNSVTEAAFDLQEEVLLLAGQIQNPVSDFNAGSISGSGDGLDVEENPSFSFDDNTASNNEENIAEYQANLESQMEFYQEAITSALGKLAELEVLIDGSATFTVDLIGGLGLIVPIDGITFPFNPDIIDFNLIDPIYLPPAFGPMSSGPMPGDIAHSSGPNAEGIDGIPALPAFLGGSTVPSFNSLAERYTEAVEAVKDFYAVYASVLWLAHALFSGTGEDDQALAALLAVSISDDLYNDKLPPLITSHASFTESLDLLYTIKGEMITTVYGMVQQYAFMLQETMEADELDEILNLQGELAQKLEPPVISSFIINPNYILWRNRADIEWVAQHPDEIVETSYAIQEGGMGEFTSAGNLESLKHFTYKRNMDEIERNYTIAVRARGSGGNTSIRMANMTLKVDPAGQNSPGGNQLPDEIPPPSRPAVSFPYNYQEFFGGWYSVYYSNDPNQIDLTISSHSEFADIAYFEYAVGTSRGATNVLDWTTAVGVLEPVNVGDGGVTRQITTSIAGLSLEHNTNYYVSVRAYDSDGNSNQNNLRSRVLYDSTPPSVPELAQPSNDFPYFFPPLWPPTPPVYPQVSSAPPWVDGKFNMPTTFNNPVINLHLADASDPESGLLHYEYVISTISDPATAFQNQADVVITTNTEINLEGSILVNPISADPISFTDSVYMHIRARNRAGTPSDAFTIYPFIAEDPSRPTSPIVNMRLFFSQLRLYLPFLGLDAESQVVGYQYSVGTSPNSTNVRGWNWGGAVDFPQNQVLNIGFIPGMGPISGVVPEPVSVPLHVIQTSGFPEQTNLYINVRSVNGQGMVSTVAVTGPFQLGTAPLQPTVSLSHDSNQGKLNISIGNIFDAGTGIRRVTFRIKNNDTGSFLTNPVTIAGAAGMHLTPHSVSVSRNVPASLSGYTVEIVVTNNANVSTTVNATYTNPPVFFPPIVIPPLAF